jgi:hypothetical protein
MRTSALVLSRFCTLIVLAALLGGCAVLKPQTCDQFDAKRRQTSYATEYRRDARTAVKPLHKGHAALAVEYNISVDADSVRTCTHVNVRKELTLARREEAGIVIEEASEFYAEDGTRITVKNENLTNQLRESGRYTASVPLPIPRGAPPGRYYLVSTLLLKSKGEAFVLAKTSAYFTVVASGK